MLTATILRLCDLWERYKVRDVVKTENTSRPLDRFLEAVLICLFEVLRVKYFSFDRFFQGG